MSTLLQKSSKKSLIREYGEALLVALVLAFVIRTFVVQAYKIPRNPWSRPCWWATTCLQQVRLRHQDPLHPQLHLPWR